MDKRNDVLNPDAYEKNSNAAMRDPDLGRELSFIRSLDESQINELYAYSQAAHAKLLHQKRSWASWFSMFGLLALAGFVVAVYAFLNAPEFRNGEYLLFVLVGAGTFFAFVRYEKRFNKNIDDHVRKMNVANMVRAERETRRY